MIGVAEIFFEQEEAGDEADAKATPSLVESM